MKNLHLKFHSETGTSKTMREAYIGLALHQLVDVATDEYLEWLEDLAEKQINQQKINEDANKVMAKFESIKLAFDNLKNEIGSVEEGEIIPDYLYNSLNEACDQLESEIYD